MKTIFLANMGPILFSETRKAAATEQVDRIITLAGFRHRLVFSISVVASVAIRWRWRGRLSVTGVDRTTAYLKQASEKATEEGLDIESFRMI